MPTGEQDVVAPTHSGIAIQASGVSGEHCNHSYLAGGALQLADSTSGDPIGGVAVLAKTVHDGGAVAAACQSRVTVTGAPAPIALLATMP